jgi:glycosyltransferase involved in cell wall biosynthesis
MQVVHINTSGSWGGLEQYTVYMVEQLLKRGIQLCIICTIGSPLYAAAKTIGVPILGVTGSRRLNRGMYMAISRLKCHCVLHVHTSIDMWTAAIASRINRLPVVLHSHMVPSKKNDVLHRIVYSTVACFVTPAQVHADCIPEMYSTCKEKVVVVRHARDSSLYSYNLADRTRLRKKYGIPENSFVVGYFGRIDRQKGIVELIEALNLVCKQTHGIITLVIMGSPTASYSKGALHVERDAQVLMQWVKDYSESNQLKDRLVVLPHTESVHVFYPMIDATVLPSYREMFSLSVLESMLAGKAVIGTASGGTIEQLTNDRGYLVEPRSASALAEALIAYATQPDLVALHATRALTWARKECSEDTIFDQYVSIYNRLLG